MALYDRLADTTYRLLRKYGRPVILRQLSVGAATYDPTLGKSVVTAAVPLDSTRNALVVDQPGSQISQRFGSTLQANSLVQQGERWLYMDAAGVKPELQDKVIVASMEYVIIDVQEMGPGGVPLFYLLVLRA